MARALGKNSAADRWLEDANAIRSLILSKLYLSEDAAFYDLDAQNQFVRVRGDVISRVLGEHVVDQTLFETIYQREIHNPKAFWAPYPLASIALDDPTFVRPIPRNSWGGASQALTALRAPRWMEHYGKPADLAFLMQQWVTAILKNGNFLQQMDPITGEFTTDTGDYSPAALVFVDFTWRLAGVRQIENALEWNLRPLDAPANSNYRLRVNPTKIAEINYANGRAEVCLNGKIIFRSTNTVRVVTDLEGNPTSAVGIAKETTDVTLRHVVDSERKFTLKPNETVRF